MLCEASVKFVRFPVKVATLLVVFILVSEKSRNAKITKTHNVLIDDIFLFNSLIKYLALSVWLFSPESKWKNCELWLVQSTVKCNYLIQQQFNIRSKFSLVSNYPKERFYGIHRILQCFILYTTRIVIAKFQWKLIGGFHRIWLYTKF